MPELLLISSSGWGGGHDGADKVKVVLLPARDLVGGNGNLCAQLHALRGCFTNPGVTTPSGGALRRHPHTLQSLDIGDHCGPGVRPPIMAGGSDAQLIRTSGSEAGCGQKLSCLPVSLRGGRLPFLPLFSHSYLHASLSIHTPTCTPPGMPAWRTARMRPVN